MRVRVRGKKRLCASRALRERAPGMRTHGHFSHQAGACASAARAQARAKQAHVGAREPRKRNTPVPETTRGVVSGTGVFSRARRAGACMRLIGARLLPRGASRAHGGGCA